MIHTLQCPNCDASLDYESDSHSMTMRCAYCNSTIIVPEILRGGVAPASASAGINHEQAEQLAKIEGLLAAGRKIEAIKLFRDTFKVSLQKAKDAVEALEEGEPFQLANSADPAGSRSHHVQGTDGRSGRRIACAVLLVLLVAVLLVLLAAGAGLGLWLLMAPATQWAEPMRQLDPDSLAELFARSLPW
jgi:DNA-directed RNA polymerase subunit RPC12/RpoP